MSNIDPEVGKILKECGLGPESAWRHKQSGKWIVSHWALEIVAAHKNISYDDPNFLVAEPNAAAVVVTGHLGDKSEWSVGEAVVGLNYTIKPKQPGYPFAMAEKRAKDRVILKLIGLHGKAYSEEEADDFKQAPSTENHLETAQKKPKFGRKTDAEFNRIKELLESANNLDELRMTWQVNTEVIKTLPDTERSLLDGTKEHMKSQFAKAA